jgi:hypothetical protein
MKSSVNDCYKILTAIRRMCSYLDVGGTLVNGADLCVAVELLHRKAVCAAIAACPINAQRGRLLRNLIGPAKKTLEGSPASSH